MEITQIESIQGLNFCFKVDNLYFAGQPAIGSLSAIKELGVTRIFNLRDESEMDFAAEKKTCEELGLEYIQFPILGPNGFIPESVARLEEMIGTDGPEFIHCGSANRIGGWSIIYLVQKRGMSIDDAVEVAYKSGLSNSALEQAARNFLSA